MQSQFTYLPLQKKLISNCECKDENCEGVLVSSDLFFAMSINYDYDHMISQFTTQETQSRKLSVYIISSSYYLHFALLFRILFFFYFQ